MGTIIFAYDSRPLWNWAIQLNQWNRAVSPHSHNNLLPPRCSFLQMALCSGTYAGDWCLCNMALFRKLCRFCRSILNIQGNVYAVYYQSKSKVPGIFLGRQLEKSWTMRRISDPLNNRLEITAMCLCFKSSQPLHGALTFQGGFLKDFHGIELSSIRPCDLPHQEHLRSRKHVNLMTLQTHGFYWLPRGHTKLEKFQ